MAVPVAVDDTNSTTEEERVTTRVLQNDTGGSLGISAVNITQGLGAVDLTDNNTACATTRGSFTIISRSANRRSWKINYTAMNGQGSDVGELVITVNGVNDAPKAKKDDASTNEDSSVSIDVLANDSDVDTSDVLSITGVVVSGGTGTASVVSGKVVYDPNGTYNSLGKNVDATVTLTYTISDGHGGTDSKDVTVTVKGRNDDPTANDDTNSAVEDGPAATGNVITASDTDPDTGDVLTVTEVGGGSVGGSVKGQYGTLVLNADGSYSYSADADLLDTIPSGTTGLQDVFTYKVSDGKGGTDSATLTIDVSTASDDRSYTGGNGNDTISGDQNGQIGAEDTIKGGNGNDTLFGLDGADMLFGGNNDDKLYGGNGIDTLFGENGNDLLDGGDGADRLEGGNGLDILLGGKGGDELYGDSGDDMLDGGDGKDLIAGGLGTDRLTGGANDDTFLFKKDGGSDTITDFQVGSDVLQLDGIFIRSIAQRDVDKNGTIDTVVQFSNGTVTLLNVNGATADQLTGTEPPPSMTALSAAHDLLL